MDLDRDWNLEQGAIVHQHHISHQSLQHSQLVHQSKNFNKNRYLNCIFSQNETEDVELIYVPNEDISSLILIKIIKRPKI